LAQKKYPEALQAIETIDTATVYKRLYNKQTTRSYAYAVSGDRINAKLEVGKSIAKYPDQAPYNIAQVYVALGDYVKALDELEKAYQVRDVWMYGLYVDPVFDPIRNEPRFKAILKKMNLE